MSQRKHSDDGNRQSYRHTYGQEYRQNDIGEHEEYSSEVRSACLSREHSPDYDLLVPR